MTGRARVLDCCVVSEVRAGDEIEHELHCFVWQFNGQKDSMKRLRALARSMVQRRDQNDDQLRRVKALLSTSFGSPTDRLKVIHYCCSLRKASMLSSTCCPFCQEANNHHVSCTFLDFCDRVSGGDGVETSPQRGKHTCLPDKSSKTVAKPYTFLDALANLCPCRLVELNTGDGGVTGRCFIAVIDCGISYYHVLARWLNRGIYFVVGVCDCH